ncbi:universal stress protein [Oceanicola sp. S124]|uniref:universal stress protein n=1 Tax=Oceanicola sp. S124 TaxID=1042378 RepID=UPI0002D3B931|nr:universal stress protein [Oceanicola sp. S124]
MYTRVMVPVDLAHKDKLGKSLEVAAKLAATFGAELVFVGVTSALPGSLAHTPDEYARKLDAFAAEQGAAHGVPARGLARIGHDVIADLDAALLEAVGETGADLVVMQSHVPNITDYVWPSHGGHLARHAKVSVLIVRDGKEE